MYPDWRQNIVVASLRFLLPRVNHVYIQERKKEQMREQLSFYA